MHVPHSSSTARQLGWAIPSVILLVAASLYVYGVSGGWMETIGGEHEFRQAQTLLSAREMMRSGLRIVYPTPLFGAPWAIPFEFPLYQWIVAIAAKVTSTGLTQTGRAVSVFFYLMTLVPVAGLLARARFDAKRIVMCISLLLASPLYIFWGRTPMIETTALCFTVWYFYLGTDAQSKRTGLSAAVLCGVLAAIVKVTTFAPAMLGVAIVLLARHLPVWRVIRRDGLRRAAADQAVRADAVKFAISATLLLAIPFFAATAWTHVADAAKAANPMGKYYVSAQLSAWNFGTLRQKLDPRTWQFIFVRASLLVSDNRWVWLALGVMAAVSRRRWLIIGYAAMFLAAPAIFTHLYEEHSYYVCANGVWLLLAIAIAAADLSERHVGWVGVFLGIEAAMALCYVGSFRAGQEVPYEARQRQWRTRVADTDPDSVVILIGFDWSGIVPFYLERRALMIPDGPRLSDDDVRQALRNLQGYKISRVIAHEPSAYGLDRLKRNMAEVGVEGVPIDRIK